MRSLDPVQPNGAVSGEQAGPTQTDPELQGSLEVQNMETSTSTNSAEEKDQEEREKRRELRVSPHTLAYDARHHTFLMTGSDG